MTETTTIRAEAERDAKTLLSATGLHSIPVDPVSVARRSGLQVRETSMGPDTFGALIKRPNEDPTIVINEDDHLNRRRFTCAHELGHFVRRSEEAEEYSRLDLRSRLSATGSDPEEVYANEFAASLLMPADALGNYVHAGMTDLEISIHFGVSRAAVQHRLRNLGLTAS